MARKARVWYPGAVYHITCRGNRHSDIFIDDRDRYRYLHYLEETKEKYYFQLHSYCLMSNHVHLLLETKDYPISSIMRKLNSRYAIAFNKRHELDGHVFQGRFHSVLIESAEQFLTTSRYIHLNPYKANMVEKPEQYKWSSYQAFALSKPDPHVTTRHILHYFHTPENYKTYVTSKMMGPDPISQNSTNA
ncbi:transposase [Bacillus sp. MUM 13]|uniref:REP-associated tyrosine transposase n=1 Tax=Bacillus sp. MUM 13 TaxID=1678001 RepID=UPI0008F5A424|nr:transposase [Bacillus sp. MUM 13]OIK10098.1 hypothetical protein BIV59_15200 [Bacillus sp. MUM 13]